DLVLHPVHDGIKVEVLPGFAWVGRTMATNSTRKGNGRHARYRAVPAAAGAGVAVDSEPGGVGGEGAAGGPLGQPWRQRPLALSGVRDGPGAVRPCRRAGLAPSG